ncbi:15339_t:CDS:2, partial [Gigaspora margarita]
MVNKSQVPIIEPKNAELKENRVQEALTNSSSLNTSWADDTEATYRKGDSLGQSKLIENSFLSSSGRSEDLMIDLETLRIEEEKNNKLTEEKEKQELPVRQWSSLFTKMQRDKATFTAVPTKGSIKTKNDNALILNIKNLVNIPLNKIILALYNKLEKSTKICSRWNSHFKQTLFGYIPTSLRRTIFLVKLRNVSLGEKESISRYIKTAIKDFGTIQGQRKESSNLENTSLNTNNNSDKAAKTIKESEDSREMNSEGEE